MAKKGDVIEIDLYRDLVLGAVKVVRQEFRVALPGRVRDFARDTSRVAVDLAVRLLGTDRVPRDEPVAQDVPVILPRGGGYGFSFDLRQGDPTFLICGDSPARSFYETGDIVSPQFPSGHHFGTAVALPGGRVSSSVPGQATPPPNEAGTATIGAEDGSATITFKGAGLPNPGELGSVVISAQGPTSCLLLGSEGAADPVACANEVLANLQALNSAIQAIPPTGGPWDAVLTAIKGAVAGWNAALQPMGDLKARVEGPTP